MTLSRRNALLATAAVVGVAPHRFWSLPAVAEQRLPPVYSVTPVAFDGVWVWENEPKDQKGIVDGREFELEVGVRWRSDGEVLNLKSSTVAPVAFPEQEVLDFRIEKSEGCDAQVVPLSGTVGQLQVSSPRLERGQHVEAKAVYRLRISRFCPHYDKSQFPISQPIGQAIRQAGLGNSPGIRSDWDSVQRIVKAVTSKHELPWDKAKRFYNWVWENIEGKLGEYTSVREAIDQKVGDCEERAGVFIALCRAAGIPARLVWVPNHSWAEFCLLDHQGQPHWIPAHTAAYNWFGWTGAHELVLQKGDRFRMPGKNSVVRLISDWYSFRGRRPMIEFFGDLKPVAETGRDAGPGQRRKTRQAGWELVGNHPSNRRIRGE